ALGLRAVSQGILPTFLLADKAVPMVATRDIGLAAARLLASGGSGKRIIHLAGPRDYSPLDVASALSRIAGKPVVAQQQPEEAMVPALLAAGMSPELSHLFHELIHGMNSGRIAWENGHALWRGETGLEAALVPFVAGN